MLAHHCKSRVIAHGLTSALVISLTALCAPGALAAASSGTAGTTGATGTTGKAALARVADSTRATLKPPVVLPAVLRAASGTAATARASSVAVPGYNPTALRSAYDLATASAHDGRGQTVAIVSAYADPSAAADLAAYRKHFGLPACNQAKGCLQVLNEHGSPENLPAPDATWASSDATALDAVSALCPLCRLILVEASSNSVADLGTAVDTAVAKGAKTIVFGGFETESPAQDVDDHYFNHPGVAIIAPAGDNGYGTSYPADLPYVTSVGGTSLTRSKFNTRHWAETAWSLTGSGCSTLEPKPSWQTEDANPVTGCMNRTLNDVAADADPTTGAAVYNSYGTTQDWAQQGGTILAASIVAAVYALAGTPAADTYPASYPYQHHRYLNDVTFGSNGSCLYVPQYLCNAGPGFDGPTGLGTPDGTGAFSAQGVDPVTVMDPGTQDGEAGTAISLRISGFDSRARATLRYTATGLPRGLRITLVPRSINAQITGILPTTDGSYTVTVTATDTKTHRRASTRFAIVGAGSLTPTTPVTTAIDTDSSFATPPAFGQCLDSGAGTADTTVTIQSCTGTAEQLWTYLPEGAPGAPDEITINGLCLGLAAGTVDLATCSRAIATQSWRQLYGGVLENTGTGTCLQAGASWTNPLTLQPCDNAEGYQVWHLLGGTVQSGVQGMCMAFDYSETPTEPASITIEPCGQAGADYVYSFGQQGQIIASYGCVVPEGNSLEASGSSVEGNGCGTSGYSSWLVLANGQLANEGDGLCIDDPGNSTVAGTQLVMAPCYGALGEIWALA